MTQSLFQSSASRLAALLALLTLGVTSLFAEDVFVVSKKGTASTADDMPCPPSCITAGSASSSGSTAVSTAVPTPVIPAGSRRVRFATANQTVWTVTPTDVTVTNSVGSAYTFTSLQHVGTGIPYEIYITQNNSGSASADVVVVMTATGGSLADTNGLPATSIELRMLTNTAAGARNVWIPIGFITNTVNNPTITLSNSAGTVSSSSRWYLDAVRFEYKDPCAGVAPQVGITGPLVSNQTFVKVTGAVAGATNVTVLTNGVLFAVTNRATGLGAGTITVTTSPLSKGDVVTALQIVTNSTGGACIGTAPGSGPIVGGGPNPPVKIFLGCSKNSTLTGPAGANGTLSGTEYFLSAHGFINFSGSAPVGGREALPDVCWQTITFDPTQDDAIDSISGTHVTNTDNYCALQSLVFAIDDLDSGPYNIYVDQIMSGTNIVENFEGYLPGRTNTFVAPNVASTPSAAATYLAAPNSSLTSQANTYGGTNACLIQWQWADTNQVRWAHVLASGASGGKVYPQLDNTKPITLRVLVLPAGISTGNKFNGTVGEIAGASPAYTTSSNVLSVAVTGAGTYTYQWMVNDAAIGDATNSSYCVGCCCGINAGWDATYSVAVNDGTCTVTKYAAFNVVDPLPSITNQPIAKTIAHVGNNVSLTVGGDGHVDAGYPLTYQWQFIAASTTNDITDATSATFSTNNVQVANAGGYAVVVGNVYGSVTSSVAIVDVVQPGVVIGTGTGLRGDYYTSHTSTNNPFGGAPTLTRTDPTVNFDWGSGSPDPSISVNLFTVRWSGQVQALDTDTYTFTTRTDDGVRLWVNGQQLINNWANQAPTEHSGGIALTTNQKYDFMMEYFENGGGAVAQLNWATAGGGVPKEIVPQSQLYPASSPVKPTLTTTVNNGTNLVLNWSEGTYNLQSASVVTGPYTTITNGITSPYTIVIDPAAPQKFYRLQVQ